MARKTGLGSGYQPPSGNEGNPRVPRRGEPLNKTRTGINSLIATGDDFGPYFLDQADTYYQGPDRSTRVKAHQFIPLNPVPSTQEERIAARGSALSVDQFKDYNFMGYIYVRFIKKGTLVRYGPVSLAQYRVFRESASKGRSVEVLPGYDRNPPVPAELGI